MANNSGIQTIYSNCSDISLYSMFRTDVWNADDPHLTLEQRMANREAALQELANRASRDYKSTPVTVEVKDMQGFGSYRHSTETVSVSKSMVQNGVVIGSNGREYSCEPSNLRAMANVYHEVGHSAQHQSKDNPAIFGDDEQTRQDVIANLKYYISPTPSTQDLYRIQISEKLANELAESKTIASIQATEPYFGKEAHLDAFKGSLTAGYDRALARAQINYNDPNIARTLQTAINDCYYNRGNIQANMPFSYYQIRTIFVDQELAAIKNSPDPSLYAARVAELNQLRSSIELAGQNSVVAQAQLNTAGLTSAQAEMPTAAPAAAAPSVPAAVATAEPGIPGAEAAQPSLHAEPTAEAGTPASETDAASTPAPAVDDDESDSNDHTGPSNDSDMGMGE